MTKDQPSPPSTEASDTQSRDETPASSLRTTTNSADMQARNAKIRALKPDLQRYLQFQQDYMTYYHYFYKLDPTDFIHCEMIDLALNYEPLLYAVVGFAAYHYELQQENPKLSHFLGYHSKSLSMLRKSLSKRDPVREGTLLTVLQLATFEEYIGDWVNLVGHHRAAYTMVKELYTPETMMESDLGRRIFSWYARLDVMVGLMAGVETRLERSWFEANAAWYSTQIDESEEDGVDIENTLAYFVSENRLIGMDMAALIAKLPKKEITVTEFHAENAKMVKRRDDMKRRIEQANNVHYRIQEFPAAKDLPLTEDDIVDPYIPGGLFKGRLWPLNFMWIDWYGIEEMQVYQSVKMFALPMPRELEQMSMEVCRIYEAIDRWPDAPNGAILGAHAGLGISTLFLPKDEKHIMWARRKLASVERQGYIFPPTFRRRMAELWGLTREQVGEQQSVEEWWLPNNEGNLQMLTEIRKIVTDRHEIDTMTNVETISKIRDLSAIFAKLDVRTQATAMPGSTSGSLSPRSEASNSTAAERAGGASFSPDSSNYPSGQGGIGKNKTNN
jgi:hypothetical protein